MDSGTQILSSVFEFFLHLLILFSFVGIHSQAGSRHMVAKMGTTIARLTFLSISLAILRGKSPLLTKNSISLSLNSSLAREMECTDYLGLVTCLNHWNRVGSSLLKSFGSSEKQFPGSWHEASETLGISCVIKCLYYSRVPWITPLSFY